MSHIKSLWFGSVLVVCAGITPVLLGQAKPGPSSGKSSPPAAKQAAPAAQKQPATQPVGAKGAAQKTSAAAQKPAQKQPAPAVRKPRAAQPAQAKAVAQKGPAKPAAQGPAQGALAKKPAVKKPAAHEAKGAAAPAGASVKAAPPEAEVKVARRDPFESLIGRQRESEALKNLPPGKAGLMISALRLDGIVRAPNGMIAVVTNPQQRTYFLRDGDQLYDGRVDKISMDSVSFHEMGKDAFGKPIERQVNKRIYPSPGEQQ